MVPLGGQWMIKWGEAMREMLGRAHVNLGGDKLTGRSET